MVATTATHNVIVNRIAQTAAIRSEELLDTKYAGSPRGSPTSSVGSSEDGNPLELDFPSMISEEPEPKNVFSVSDARRCASAKVADKLRGDIRLSRVQAAAPVRVGFRADLDQALQLREVKNYHATKAAHYQMEDHMASTMDWCDTVAGCKWRLKMMIVDAAAQRRTLIAKKKAEGAAAAAGSIPAMLPLKHIMEDIDTFFHPVHLQKVGTPLKAYNNVKRQLLFKMDLFARGENAAAKVDV